MLELYHGWSSPFLGSLRIVLYKEDLGPLFTLRPPVEFPAAFQHS